MRKAGFTLLPAIALVLGLSSPSAAAEPGRYTMTPTDGGVLRLDTETGNMSLCRKSLDSWSCVPVEQQTSDLQKRVEQLEKENAALRAQLANRALPMPQENLEIPSEKDVDKAMDFVERILNRVQGMINNFKKQEQQDQPVAPPPAQPQQPAHPATPAPDNGSGVPL